MKISKELILLNLSLLQSSHIEVRDIPKVIQLIQTLKQGLADDVKEIPEREEEGLKELFDD